jgi:hypothetical protein
MALASVRPDTKRFFSAKNKLPAMVYNTSGWTPVASRNVNCTELTPYES